MKLHFYTPSLFFVLARGNGSGGRAVAEAVTAVNVLESPDNFVVGNDNGSHTGGQEGGSIRGAIDSAAGHDRKLWRKVTATHRHDVDTTAASNWDLAGIGDIDGDGSDDIVWQEKTTSTIVSWILKENGREVDVKGTAIDGSNDGPDTVTTWNVVDVKDFDGDGIDDLLVKGMNEKNEYVCMIWYLNNQGQYSGDNHYNPYNCLAGARLNPTDTSINYGHDIYDLLLTDNNGDSEQERLLTEFMNRGRSGQDQKYISLGNTNGYVDFKNTWNFVGTAKLQQGNNGAIDAIVFQEKPNVANGRGYIAFVYGELANKVAVIWDSPNHNSWKILGMGDINGDSVDDFVFQNKQNGQVHAWIMHPTNVGSIMEKVDIEDPVGTAPGGWTCQGIGEFNGDNKSDIVWRHGSNGAVNIWLM